MTGNLVNEIVEVWTDRNVKGLRLAELLWNFSESPDASLDELQEAFIRKDMAPPDPATISRHITVWGEWVERRGYNPERLEKIGVDKLYYMRKVPREKSEEWLEKAKTMTHRELMKTLGDRAPKMILKLDASLRGIIENTFLHTQNTLRTELDNPDFTLTQSQTIELMCQIVNEMHPKLLKAIWRSFIGEADAVDYVLANRALGYAQEQQ